jgi:2-oxo-4-hydroxy-4-carboxy-5-ureidoimidazoline decarboxylase
MTSVPTQARISLSEINTIPREEFVFRFSEILEHSPQFAERVSLARPFSTVDDLHAAFASEVDRAPHEEKLALLRAHPDLADRMVRLTDSSTNEQASAGLDLLDAGELDEFKRLNTAYRDRFHFPFIICARLNSKETILAAFRSRSNHSVEEEFETALMEVKKIARLRLLDLVHG